MSLRGQTFPTVRELVKFLTDNDIPWGVCSVIANFSGHLDLIYDTDGMDAIIVEASAPTPAHTKNGDDVEIAGLVPGAPYDLTLFSSTLATTTGFSTHRQRTVCGAPGGALPYWQETAAVALADSVCYPFSPGLGVFADSAGKLYVNYAVTPGAAGDDIVETLTLHLRRIR